MKPILIVNSKDIYLLNYNLPAQVEHNFNICNADQDTSTTKLLRNVFQLFLQLKLNKPGGTD